MELGPLAQRSLKSPFIFYLPILFPCSLKGHLKESEPGILRAVVARIRKHCPQRVEKSEKGKKGESRLASSPVPPGVDKYPKKRCWSQKEVHYFTGRLGQEGVSKPVGMTEHSCHMWGDEETRPSLCAGCWEPSSCSPSTDLLPFLPSILFVGFLPELVSQAG